MFSTVCCFVIIYVLQSISGEFLQVDLPIGSVIGKHKTTAEGKSFYTFLSIPYAEPPIGELRFVAPVEKKPWKGVIDGTKESNICYQSIPGFAASMLEDEDCLYINVHTPVLADRNASLPVMFFIHGGAYQNGFISEHRHGPDHIIDKDVILVTFNYRVGVFGFLAFGDTVLPGNAGLKDQNLALQWTNKYIEYFGGDPAKITIFGSSAGAASVAYHLLSDQSAGLFRAAISESGSSLGRWAMQNKLIYISRRLAKNLNEDASNYPSAVLLKYLQSLPATLVRKTAEIQIPGILDIVQGLHYTPTMEPEHDGAFLTKRPFELFESGKYHRVPVMMGFTSREMISLAKHYYKDYPKYAKTFNEDHTQLVPWTMNAQEKNKKTIGDAIYKFYVQNQTFSDNEMALVDYLSDLELTRSQRKQAELMSKYSDVYFYQFAYKGFTPKPDFKFKYLHRGDYDFIVKQYSNYHYDTDTCQFKMNNLVHHLKETEFQVEGFSPDVPHCDEMKYIFSMTGRGFNSTDWTKLNQADRSTAERVITMWTNFAKYQNPTPTKVDILQNITWPKVDASFPYLDIGSWMEIKNKPKDSMYSMWEKLYDQWGVPPYSTY